MESSSHADLTSAIVAGVATVLVAVLSAWWHLLSVKQTQLKEVITKRMSKAYPELWCLLQTNVSNWIIERKAPTAKWASELLANLNTCHAEFGVFFSQPVYEKFFKFRDALIKINERAADKAKPISPSLDDLHRLEQIWSGYEGPGLASALKDDLGSYQRTLFSFWPR